MDPSTNPSYFNIEKSIAKYPQSTDTFCQKANSPDRCYWQILRCNTYWRFRWKKDYCGFASGWFKDLEIHYHSTFKKILAVKYAIKKFNYHLIGHHFLIECDMSAYHSSTTVSQYSFEVHHIVSRRLWIFSQDLIIILARGSRTNPYVLNWYFWISSRISYLTWIF